MQKKENKMEKLVSLAKRRGFVYPGSEIYGGLANTWDYGPYGVQLKKNIIDAWWRRFVENRLDMVGMDSAIFMNPKVWEASGHVDNFTDPLVDCKECKERFRADHLAEENGVALDEVAKLPCPNCKGELTEPRTFNLMFETHIGPVSSDNKPVYLRGEIAQGMFVNFKNVIDTMRMKLPFGIAQYGKAFRNEITAGNYLFRQIEFNLMEFEYFIAPPKSDEDWQKVFEEWLGEMKEWIRSLGIKDDEVYFHEIEGDDLAHYSKRTVDIEYHYPFGLKELYGLAYRTDHDLKNHMEASGADMRYTDPNTGEKYLPHVIEPSFGIDRTFLATILSAYDEEEAPTANDGEVETRVVMRLPKHLAPVQVAVLPLSKKEPLQVKAKEIAKAIGQKQRIEYDESGSIGKRYRRQDEIGTPYCVTVDFDTLEDGAVTVRDRDTMRQDRVAIVELYDWLARNL
ncbi:glycine--tRNA ligase [Candidatus Uhrbacteria bacterium]|nr:glycine--tRNA ligase [Candidatus Uhrbacteria bacterium]